MQVVRDAIVLLVVVLIIATVRVSPVPEITLSPAQAAQATRPAASAETRTGAEVPAQDPAAVDPANCDNGDGREKPPCDQSMAARSKVQQGPGDAALIPCQV